MCALLHTSCNALLCALAHLLGLLGVLGDTSLLLSRKKCPLEMELLLCCLCLTSLLLGKQLSHKLLGMECVELLEKLAAMMPMKLLTYMPCNASDLL